MSRESEAVLSGAVAGLAGGVVAAVITQFAVEPAIEAAIAFENTMAHAAGEEHAHGEVISRGVQSTVGVLTSVGLFGAAIGIFIAIAAYALGRLIPELTPRMRAVTATALAFLSGFLVPFLVYPSNPPAVGSEASLASRTAMYYAMVAISLIAMMAAVAFARALSRRIGWWNASLSALGAYLVVVIALATLLPTRTELNGNVAEIPEGFPAATLADFRAGSLLVAGAMYAVILVALPAVTGMLTRRGERKRMRLQDDRVPTLIGA